MHPPIDREHYLRQLADGKIALLGLGIENQAVARFLRAHDLPFAVCDCAAPEQLADLRSEFAGVEEGSS